jgi:hypothetical protein
MGPILRVFDIPMQALRSQAVHPNQDEVLAIGLPLFVKPGRERSWRPSALSTELSRPGTSVPLLLLSQYSAELGE